MGGLALAGSMNANAIPIYARQTGQACVTCHLGGMYPQLTSYGRLFKLTGYTMGTRPNLTDLEVQKDAPPISVWLQAGRGFTNKNNAASQPGDTQNIQAISLFSGGKITDNIGGFLQWTGGNTGGGYNFTVDNSEIRYADRNLNNGNDLIYGVYVNNHPTVSDVWNNTANWNVILMGFYNANAAAQTPQPFLDQYGPGQSEGIGAYLYKDTTWYAEAGVYKSFTHGIATTDLTAGSGSVFIDPSPYYRLAYSKDIGAHSFEVGMHGMISYAHNGSWGTTVNTYRDTALDAQYQYNLDPHYIGAHARFLHESSSFAGDQVGTTAANGSNYLNEAWLDVSYVYQAKYGGTLTYRNITGSNDLTLNALNTTTGSPNWQAWIPEIFWTPWQNLRLGFQYTVYTQMAGATSVIPGQTLKPSDFNTSAFYVSFIY